MRALEKIRERYLPKYKNIAIVTHFMFLDCISATRFDEECVPQNGIKAKNCQVHSVRFDEIVFKKREES